MPSTKISDGAFEPSNSVDLLQNRARQIANQSLQSTQRMVVMVDDAKETMASLEEQKEKLNRMDQANNEIREEMHESEKVLNEMEKCCGICVLPWKRPRLTKVDQLWKKDQEVTIVTNQPQLVREDSAILNSLPRITNDAMEEETNENLMHVHDTVRNLKSMASGLKREVHTQNKHIDKLILKADGNDQRVQSAAQRTDNIRKS